MKLMVATTLALLTLPACKHTQGGSAAKGAASDVASTLSAGACDIENAVLTKGISKAGETVGMVQYLIKMGVVNGTNAKNICSCIFVAGLAPKDCLQREPQMNVRPGAPVFGHYIIVDTSYIAKTVVTRIADPAHPGGYLGVVTTSSSHACAGLGGPDRVARYVSAMGKFGCTLDGPLFQEAALP